MPHGTPDYGITAGRQTTHQLTDLGELAVRLGSPVSFDRRGDVVWWDDFECSLNKWNVAASGTGSSIAVSTASARNGENSCKLTAGSDGAHSAAMIHRHHPPVRSVFGSEVSWAFTGTPELLLMRIDDRDGVTNHAYEVVWDNLLNEVKVLTAAGTYSTVLSSLDLLETLDLFHTIKLVWDGVTHQLVRLLFDHLVIDVSGVGAQDSANVFHPRIAVKIDMTGRAGFNDVAYIDDYILTQNEPT